MDSIQVQGGIALQGKVNIQGSKNAALPILAACLLMSEPVLLKGCPRISDVQDMISILESLGCSARWGKDGLTVFPGPVKCGEMPSQAVAGMRSSVFLLGALLARCGRVQLDYPGGCVIGKRPIDLHIQALRALGVRFEEGKEKLSARAEDLNAAEIRLGFPSVGATENLILCATAAQGITRIYGAAREPEVQSLCEFLNHCGAGIEGAGTSMITVEGGRTLRGTTFQVPGDRIVAGTYLLAGFACGGSMLLENVPVRQMEAVFYIAERMGALLTISQDSVYAQCPERAGKLAHVRTDVYPGFPTDLQSILLAVRCKGEGTTLIRENIFENRFRIMDPLMKMGARITPVSEREVKVCGVEVLQGMQIEAKELRGGAALVVAGLGAKGRTLISGRHFIERGYENICRDLMDLGARVSTAE